MARKNSEVITKIFAFKQVLFIPRVEVVGTQDISFGHQEMRQTEWREEPRLCLANPLSSHVEQS
jgi:hypothetical protein